MSKINAKMCTILHRRSQRKGVHFRTHRKRTKRWAGLESGGSDLEAKPGSSSLSMTSRSNDRLGEVNWWILEVEFEPKNQFACPGGGFV